MQTNEDLDFMVKETVAEYADNLRAIAVLFDIPMEQLEERSAIVQYDGGARRTTADRYSARCLMKGKQQGLSDALCDFLFDHADDILRNSKEYNADPWLIMSKYMEFREELKDGRHRK